MTTKTINKLNIYKFILRILKYPLFHNIFFSLIFIISFNFWYSILLLLTSKIKDTNIFYLMFKTSIFFGILYLIICHIRNKKLQQLFISVLAIILACLLIPKNYAYAESIQILSQLQRHQLHLLKARIELEEFGSIAPHLFTIFNSQFDGLWYMDVPTHAPKYGNIQNHLLSNVSDFSGGNRKQFIARFQLNNHCLPDISK